MFNNKLVSNFLHLTSLQGLTFILPLITMPYLFRVLGAEKFGLVAFALATVTFFKIFVDYGFHLTATREISLNHDNKNNLIEIYSQTIITKLFLLGVCFFILNILIILLEKFSNNWLLFYSSFLFVVGHTIFPIWFFQGMEDMKYISYFNIISKIIFTIGIFLFITSPSDYILYPFINGLSIIIIGIFSMWLIYKKYDIKLVKQSFSKIQETLKKGWNIFLAEFTPSLYNNFTIFFLGFIVSMENVGYYSLANKIIDIATSILYIIRNVTYPYLNKNFNKFKKITKTMIIIGTLFTIMIFGLSHLFVPLVFGEKAYNILNLVYILAFTPLIFSFTLSFGSNYLLVLKEDKLYRDIIIKISLFGTILSLILVDLFGIYGGAITVLIVRFLIAFFLTKAALNKNYKMSIANENK